MGKFIKNVIVIAAAVNFAASVWYIFAGVVPLGVLWEATVSSVKAGWPVYPLGAAGVAALMPRTKNWLATGLKYAGSGACAAAAIYFVVISNIAFYKVMFVHTSVLSLALAAIWVYAAAAIGGYALDVRSRAWIPTPDEVNHFARKFSGNRSC